MAADRVIINHCHTLAPALIDKQTVMEMLWDADFYRDVLYHSEYGAMLHSGPLTGTPGDRAKSETIAWLAERQVGESAVNYRLHDWLISRQRYWGAPIPMIYCPDCGTVPVPYEDLPVLLPADVEFMPTGESPLRFHQGLFEHHLPPLWRSRRNVKLIRWTPLCARRGISTLTSPPTTGRVEPVTAEDTPVDPAEMEYWAPVDQYTGGIEHATMHLIYTRFFTKAMRDMGLGGF